MMWSGVISVPASRSFLTMAVHQHGEQQRVRHHVVSLVHQVDSVGLGQVAQNVHGLVYTRDTTGAEYEYVIRTCGLG